MFTSLSILYFLFLLQSAVAVDLLAIAIPSSNKTCHGNGPMHISVDNQSHMFATVADWTADDFEVTDSLSVSGKIAIQRALNIHSLHVGSGSFGVHNETVRAKGIDVMDQTGWHPAIEFKDRNGHARVEITDTYATRIETDSIQTNDMVIAGKVDITQPGSTFHTRIDINGGAFDASRFSSGYFGDRVWVVGYYNNAWRYRSMPYYDSIIGGGTANKPPISLYATRSIYSTIMVVASDRRIKKDIEPVPDKLALEILRKLDAKYYHYKDIPMRGPNRTIGFIAQEVREVIPEAVTLVEKVVPDEMRDVSATFRVVGKQIVMALAEPVAVGVYRFYVSKEKDASDEVERTWTTEDGVHFDVDDHYTNVFLYGRRHDDFHLIDKQKIFAVAYAALQQIDKTQQALQKDAKRHESHSKRILDLTKTFEEQDIRIKRLETELDELESKKD